MPTPKHQEINTS